jgi:hypothetical protein
MPEARHACAAGGSADVDGRWEQGVADRAGRNRDRVETTRATFLAWPGHLQQDFTAELRSHPPPVLLRHAPAEHPCSAQSRESRRGTAQIILSGAALTASRQHRNRRADRRRCARLRIPGLITLRKGGAPARRFRAGSAVGLPFSPGCVVELILYGRRAGVDVAGCGVANRAPRWRMKYPSPESGLGGLGRPGQAAVGQAPGAFTAHERRLHPDRTAVRSDEQNHRVPALETAV